MGEAYKGLTVRIGGDVTGLKKALRSSSSAISQTQKELRGLEKAAKLDPSGMALMSERIETVGDKARALTSKMHVLSKAIKDAERSGMMQVAEQTKDAALNAEVAQDRYAKVCRQIRELKNAVSAAAGASEKVWNDLKSADEVVAKMRELEAEEKQVAEYMRLVGVYGERLKDLEFAKQIRDLSELKATASALEVEVGAVYDEMARMATASSAFAATDKFARFRSEMAHLDLAAKELRADFARLDQALKLDPGDIDAARLKMASMQEQVRLNVIQIGKINEQLDEMRRKGVDMTSAEFKDLALSVSHTEGVVSQLNMKLDQAKVRLAELRSSDSFDEQSEDAKRAKADVEMYEKQLKSAKAHLDRLGDAQAYRKLKTDVSALNAETNQLIGSMTRADGKFGKLGASMQQLGWSAYSTLTPAFTMIGYGAINAAETVDAAYRDMRKTVQGTEEQFEALKDSAIEFSLTHVTTADQILEIEAMGGQLGVATDKLGVFSETVSSLEIATNLDADTAAEQLGQLAGILNDMTQDDFPKYGDALVRLGNNNATLEDKIQDVMLRIASMGTITGFSTTELLAWSTAIASTGQGAEAAGTAISNTMSDIENAVGKGGDSLNGFASVAHMSADEFASAWNTDPSSAMYAFIQGLKDIEANGGSADQTLVNLGITGVRQKQAILGLMQTIDGLNANLQMSENAWNGVSDEWGAAGDAAREAERKAEGFSGAIQRLRNAAQGLGVEVGESMAPVITELADILANLTKMYKTLPQPVKDAINAFMLLAAALGPVVVAGQAVVRAFSDVRELMSGGMKSAWRSVVKESEAMNAALIENAARTKGVEAGTVSLTNAQKTATVAAGALKVALKAIAPMAAMYALVEVVGLVAGSISDAHEKAANLEKATAGLSEATDRFGESFGEMTEGMAQADFGAASRSFGELRDSIDESIARQAALADEMTQSWDEINGNAYLIEQYMGVIEELAGKEGLTASEQEKLKAAVKGYNEICGTSYSVTDALNGELNASIGTLRKTADQWIVVAKAQALQEHATELMSEQYKLKRDLADAETKHKNALDAYNNVVDSGNASSESYLNNLAETETALSDAQAAYDANAEAVDELNAEYEEIQGEIAATGEAVGGTTEEVQAANEAMGKLVDELSEYVTQSPVFAQMLADSGWSVDTLAQKMSDAGISADDLKTGVENASSAACNALGKIEIQSGITLDQMLANLQSNADVTQAWADNLVILYERAGSDSEIRFLQYIQDLGVQYAPIVQQLVDDSSGKLTELAAAYERSGSAGATAYLAQIGILPGEAAETAQATTDAVAQTFTDETPTAVNAMAGLVEGVDYTASEGAAKTSDDFADNLSSGESVAKANAQTMAANAAMMNMHAGKAYGWGQHLGRNFASGIAGSSWLVRNAATGLASTVERILGHSVAEEGPLHVGGRGEAEWGRHTVLNYVQGMKEEERALRREAERLAQIAASGLSGTSIQADLANDVAAGRRAALASNGSSVVNNYYSIDGMTYQEGTPEGDAVKAVFDVVRRSASANPTRRR